MEGLLVDGEDGHARSAKQAWIVQRADLEDDGRQARAAGDKMRAAGFAIRGSGVGEVGRESSARARVSARLRGLARKSLRARSAR